MLLNDRRRALAGEPQYVDALTPSRSTLCAVTTGDMLAPSSIELRPQLVFLAIVPEAFILSSSSSALRAMIASYSSFLAPPAVGLLTALAPVHDRLLGACASLIFDFAERKSENRKSSSTDPLPFTDVGVGDEGVEKDGNLDFTVPGELPSSAASSTDCKDKINICEADGEQIIRRCLIAQLLLY